MNLSQFRKELKENTNFKLKIKSFSFGKQASFIHKEYNYKFGSITTKDVYEFLKLDIEKLRSFLHNIPANEYANILENSDINLSIMHNNSQLKAVKK